MRQEATAGWHDTVTWYLHSVMRPLVAGSDSVGCWGECSGAGSE